MFERIDYFIYHVFYSNNSHHKIELSYFFKSMKILKIFLCVLFVICDFLSNAQNQTNIWMFGANCKLDFTSGTPVAGLPSAINTYEGCASISDSSGHILFYTDGITVWNKNNLPMPNGTGLMGDNSSTQSSIIVPQPGNASIYFVFTVDYNGGTNGFRYSVVNISLNGGLGDVTTKNVLLLADCYERMTAVRHGNNSDCWVVVQDFSTDEIKSFLVTASGLNVNPVVSNVGVISGGDLGKTGGYMKASPDGCKLVVALWANNSYEMLDFNKYSGTVSNRISLQSPDFPQAYGVEFSPDSKLLYVSAMEGPTNVFQMNLSAGSASAIVNSKVLLFTTLNMYDVGGLQLGPDGKIYCARRYSQYLAVINSPNTIGTGCNFIYNGVSLPSTMQCQLGLPSFIPAYLRTPFSFSHTIPNCSRTVDFFLSDTSIVNNVLWNFGYPPSGNSNTSTVFFPSHTFSSHGLYHVSVIVSHGCSVDTIKKTVTINSITPIVWLGNDTSICNGNKFILDAGNSGSTYLWQDGSTDERYEVSQSGIFWVMVQTACDTVSDSITVVLRDCEDTCSYASFIANCFTPNGDSVNDTYYPKILCPVSNYEFIIFNRWGEKIFETNNEFSAWDGNYKGKNCPESVYYWCLHYDDNSQSSSHVHSLRGFVTLLR